MRRDYQPGVATQMMNERDAALDRAEAAEAAQRRVLALCEGSTTGMVSVVKVVAALYGTETQRDSSD